MLLIRIRVKDHLSISQCLTCNDTIKIPFTEPVDNSVPLATSENCLYYMATFSQGGGYYVLECLGDRIPITYVKSVDEPTFERNKTVKS